MTSRFRRKESYVINGALAAAVFYYAVDLSSSGRTLIDWLVITAVILAIAWNVIQLSRRLRVLGNRAVWHVQRTVLFWTIGLMDTVYRAADAQTDWKFLTGLALVVIAAVERIGAWGVSQPGYVIPMPLEAGLGLAFAILVFAPGEDGIQQTTYFVGRQACCEGAAANWRHQTPAGWDNRLHSPEELPRL